MAMKLGRTAEAAARPVVRIVTILYISKILLDCKSHIGNSMLRSCLGTCTDGLKNGGETGIDCGGRCNACLGKHFYNLCGLCI